MTANHSSLVNKAVSWLINKQKCQIVIAEMTSGMRETPDAIGWRYGFSYLIECKASRQDFFNDKKKFFRANPEYGIGDFRYYLTPKNMVTWNEVPEGWGLIEYEYKNECKKESIQWKVSDKKGEIIILTSAFRRTKGIKPIGVNLKCYGYGGTKNRASIFIEKEDTK